MILNFNDYYKLRDNFAYFSIKNYVEVALYI